MHLKGTKEEVLLATTEDTRWIVNCWFFLFSHPSLKEKFPSSISHYREPRNLFWKLPSCRWFTPRQHFTTTAFSNMLNLINKGWSLTSSVSQYSVFSFLLYSVSAFITTLYNSLINISYRDTTDWCSDWLFIFYNSSTDSSIICKSNQIFLWKCALSIVSIVTNSQGPLWQTRHIIII